MSQDTDENFELTAAQNDEVTIDISKSADVDKHSIEKNSSSKSSLDEDENVDETTVALTAKGKKTKNGKKEAKIPEAKVGFFTMFRFADKLDVLLMVVATICMIVLGATMPINLYFFGSLMNDFIAQEWAALNYTSACSNTTMTSATTFDRDFLVDVIINVYVVAFCGLGVASFTLSYVGMSFWTWTGNRQVRRVQAAYFKAIMAQSIKWFDMHDTGELNSRIVGDVERLNDGFGDKMASFIQWIFTFIGGLVLGFAVSWRLMLVVVAACPALVLTAAAVGRLVRTLLRKELLAYAKAGSVAEEIFSSIRTVAAFGGEKKAEERYAASLEGVVRGGVKKSTASGLTGGLFWLILYCIIGLAFWYGGVLIRTLCLPPGSILQVLLGVMVGSVSLGNAVPLLDNFSNARAAAAVLFGTIDEEVEIDSTSDKGIKAESLEGNIEFRDVHFSYPARKDVKILNGLNLSVKKGETVALVGESGCGKSTTIQLLQRYYDCHQGQVMIDGKDLKEYNITSLRNFMGIVGQEPVLFGATIGENIKLGAKWGEEVTQEQVETAAKQSNCYDFISKLPKGFDTAVGERGVQLSGGQKQRIAIARALVRNPAILLLDEATSALDTQSEATVQDALDKAGEGRTTIVIAHRLSTVRNASKICAFKQGQVHEEGTHSELLAKEGIYYSLVMKQQQAMKKEALQLQKDLGPKSPTSPPADAMRSPLLPRAGSSFRRSRTSSLRRSRFGSLKDVVSSAYPLGLDYDDDVEDMADELPAVERQVLSRQLSNSRPDLSRRESVTSQEIIKRVLSNQATLSEADAERYEAITMKEIWQMNKPESGLIAIGFLASVLLGVAQPCFVLAMTGLISAVGIPDFDLQEQVIATYVGYIILVGFGTALFTIIQNFMIGLSGEKMTARLRNQFFSAILKQDIGYFDREENGVGQLTSQLATDASLVKGATGLRLGIMTQTAVSVIGVIVLSFVSAWELSLVMLICFPIVMLAGRVRQQVLSGYSAQDKAAIDMGGKIAQEAISNMRTVTSLNRQRFFVDQFYDHFKVLYKANLKSTFGYGISYAISASMQFFMYAIAFGLGGYFIICDCLPWRSQPLTFDNIMRVFAAVTFGGISAGKLFSQVPDLNKARLAAANIKDLLTRVSPIDPTSPDGEMPSSCEGKVKFNDVTFHYPTRKTVPILQGLTFTIEKGQVVALVGASGCGKSTSISLLERFYDPISGSVTMDGIEVNKLNLRWLRQNIGIVSQEPTLFDASIAENIAYGDNTREVPMAEIIEAAKKSNAHNFITSLPQGYETNVGAKGTQLSGGQKQRIAIARALVRNPAILLLDEATSALDTESEKIVQAALDEALKDRSAIVIAHRLSTIRNADKIGVVSEGKMVETGTHQELLDLKGSYFNLVNGQL